MNCGILRPFLLICFSLSFGLLVTTASAAPIDLEQKLLDTATRDPLLERQIEQLLSSIERGQLDQVVQATIQQFFSLLRLVSCLKHRLNCRTKGLLRWPAQVCWRSICAMIWMAMAQSAKPRWKGCMATMPPASFPCWLFRPE